jgi:hypothetical protein
MSNGGNEKSETDEIWKQLHELKTAQAVQAATQAGAQATQAAATAGAQATQAAASAGIMTTMAAGFISLVVGVLLGWAVRRS